MMQCPECSSYNDSGAAFCSQCGRKIARTKTAARRQSRRAATEDRRRENGGEQNPSNRSRRVVRALFFFFAVGLVGTYLVLRTQRVDEGVSGPLSTDQAETDSLLAAVGDGDPTEADLTPETVDAVVEPPTERELLKKVKTAFVSLELKDADADPLKTTRGVLVSPRGVLLTRLSSLFGAASATVRVGGRGGSFEVIGAPQVDPIRDLALLEIRDTPERALAGDETDRVFPSLPVLSPEDSNELLERGLELFVASEQTGVFAVVTDFPHFSFDRVGRARVAEEPGLPRNPLVALDAYGHVVGMCRLDSTEFDGQQARTLVEPVDRLVGALDLQSTMSLAQISEQYFDGTFSALMIRAEKALKAQDWRLACRQLLAAGDQAAQENVSGEPLERAVDLLRKSIRALMPDLKQEGHTGALAALMEQVVAYLPGERDVWLALAGAYLTGGSYGHAIRTACEAGSIQRGADVEEILQSCYLKLAEQSAETGDLTGAAEVLLEGIEQVRSGKLHFELAKIYESWEYYVDAARVFQMAAALDPRMNADVEIYLDKIDAAIKRLESVVIPLQPGSSVHKTNALVNGRDTFEFIIDTGATYTAISESVRRSLGVHIGPGTRRVPVTTANGRIMAPLVELESLAIQGFTVHNLKALVLTNHRGDLGLLGLNFLNNFKYTFDSSRELILQRR